MFHILLPKSKMAKTDFLIPQLGDKFIDLRGSLPGDSFNWNWERDLSLVEYLAIHESSGPDTQTPREIAQFHISTNGWGGIGYHFLIAKDGTVYYVGDISTARANVANLNEAVIGICLIGNFVEGQVPTPEQLDSSHKLCVFLLSYQQLPNVNSWASVRGHKELPNQATDCPGDNWSSWRLSIVEGTNKESEIIPPLLGIFDLESQIKSLQTSLASVNQRAIFLQEALQEREQEIRDLKSGNKINQPAAKFDQTLTIPQALVKLYQTILPPGKES